MFKKKGKENVIGGRGKRLGRSSFEISISRAGPRLRKAPKRYSPTTNKARKETRVACSKM